MAWAFPPGCGAVPAVALARIAKSRRLPYTSPTTPVNAGAVFFIHLSRGAGGFASRPTSVYENKSLICKDCGNPFDFTARDQMFYAEKGFENEPQRCRDCRNVRKTQRSAALGQAPSSTAGLREMFDAVCAQCGAATTLPFRPRGDRPVYCRTCYSEQHAVRI
jgi:CxxC-x17-CxxC domain-containing protein